MPPRFPERPDFVGRYVRLLYLQLLDELDAGTADAYPEVSPAMKQVLMLVSREGSRLTDMATAGRMTKQSMGEHVNALVELDLLERIPDPADGRAKLIRPTRAGVACMSDAYEVAVDVHRHWEHLLGERKTDQLQRLLRELVQKLDAEATEQRARYESRNL